ncbi:BadF/BadG/BcrA/BcrD ATPase family protein [Nonomuraea sp. NPDC026600]|uniref:N-acetylglucosamine kinase n=1 Tax=Nonomuraea sp. NPDC026600 TaxID=3155363 RepID=UPI0033C12C16
MDLAIDGGQTGLRLALATGGRIQEVYERPGLSYAEGSPVEAVLSRIGDGWGDLDTVCLGLTTILDDPEGLATRLLRTARRVMVTTDVVTSHAGAFSGGPGVVLAAGTGAIALGVSTDGGPGSRPAVVRQVDGWGFLYGDAGGGYWIGRRGLEAAARGFDGRAPGGPLTRRARDVFGDLAGLPARLYLSPDGVAQVAGFAVHVLELARDDLACDGTTCGALARDHPTRSDTARDDTARAIVGEAARELAATAAAAARAFPGDAEVPVAWTGRLLRDPALRAGFEAELADLLPRARLRPPAGDSLAGAALLAATEEPGLHGTMIRTVRR